MANIPTVCKPQPTTYLMVNLSPLVVSVGLREREADSAACHGGSIQEHLRCVGRLLHSVPYVAVGCSLRNSRVREATVT